MWTGEEGFKNGYYLWASFMDNPKQYSLVLVNGRNVLEIKQQVL